MKKLTAGVLATTLALLGASALKVRGSDGLQAGEAQQPGDSVRAETIAQQRILYIDPKRGTDTAGTGENADNPLRTITAALEMAESGTILQLAPGRYSAGETFPLKIKPGVILRGNEARQGEGVVIVGSGRHVSRSWAGQNVTILAERNSQILGVTVTNTETRGTGVWVEDANPAIRNSTFTNNNREGIFVSGQSQPVIENSKFMYNGGNGISVTREASGEIRGNLFLDTGFGLAIGHTASPIVANNQIRQNRIGVVVTQAARPILSENIIENNSDYGLVAIAQAEPQVAANNIFRGNEREDQLIARGPQGTPPTPETQERDRAVFTCEPYSNGFATVVQKGKSSIPQPMIIWKTAQFDSPESRCLEVTQRLNDLVAQKEGKFDKMLFATGRVSNSKVVCLVNNVQESCQPNNMLFQLSGANASNPAEVLRRLIAFSVKGGGNPVQEAGEEAIAPLASVAESLQPELGLWFVDEGVR